jgi:hypothetical protein
VNHDAQTRYTTRKRVLNLLSDVEIAGVNSAETADHLEESDEYLDLEHLDQGVLRASKDKTPMGRVLRRKAVPEETWGKILRELTGPRRATPHSGGLWEDSY